VKTGKEDNLEKETAAAMANQKSSSGKTRLLSNSLPKNIPQLKTGE
jgi:hypothetical protein